MRRRSATPRSRGCSRASRRDRRAGGDSRGRQREDAAARRGAGRRQPPHEHRREQDRHPLQRIRHLHVLRHQERVLERLRLQPVVRRVLARRVATNITFIQSVKGHKAAGAPSYLNNDSTYYAPFDPGGKGLYTDHSRARPTCSTTSRTSPAALRRALDLRAAAANVPCFQASSAPGREASSSTATLIARVIAAA